MDEMLEANRKTIKFSHEVYAEFETVGFNFLIVFNALGHYYSSVCRPALKLFNVIIKAHYLAHCIMQAKYVNPRLGWCYAGDDFMFRVRRLLAACVKHNGPAAATVSLATAYRLGMHLLLKDMRSD